MLKDLLEESFRYALTNAQESVYEFIKNESKQGINMDLSELIKKVAAMPNDKFERWIKRNGYTGMAAVRLSQKRQEASKIAQH